MKVIFLDIDGVLCSGDYMWTSHMLRRMQSARLGTAFNDRNSECQPVRDDYGNLFDPRCVKFLTHERSCKLLS